MSKASESIEHLSGTESLAVLVFAIHKVLVEKNLISQEEIDRNVVQIAANFGNRKSQGGRH